MTATETDSHESRALPETAGDYDAPKPLLPDGYVVVRCSMYANPAEHEDCLELTLIL